MVSSGCSADSRVDGGVLPAIVGVDGVATGAGSLIVPVACTGAGDAWALGVRAACSSAAAVAGSGGVAAGGRVLSVVCAGAAGAALRLPARSVTLNRTTCPVLPMSGTVGLYASSNGQPSNNIADFDWFEYVGL